MIRLASIVVLSLWLPTTVFAQAEALSGVASPVDQILRVGLGLAVVVTAIGVVSWIARGMLKGHLTSGGPMRVLAGLSLGARERIVLLQVGETQLVVGIAPGRIQTLHVLSEPLPEAEQPGDRRPFAEQLASIVAKRHGRAADVS